MIPISLACQFISDYDLLSDNERAEFEDTWVGDLLDVTLSRLETQRENQYFFNWLSPKTLPPSTIEAAKNELIPRISDSKEYQSLIQKINAKKKHIEFQGELNAKREALLTSRYFIDLKRVCDKHINILSLDNFNKIQADHLAKNQLLIDFSLNAWFLSYKSALVKYIETNLALIDGIDSLNEQASLPVDTTHSLSKLFVNSIGQENTDLFINFLNNVADAHGFIQATGFSTQNENSYLGWLDIYNYKRATPFVAEAKYTLYKFLKPFKPLFDEYYDITHKEHNLIRQIIRTLMPMLVISTAIVCVSLVLPPAVVSEIAFMLILVPTLYIGLVLATSYVVAKDTMYHKARQYYYGGQFNIPEFQINPRMEAGFETAEKATLIRNFYVNALQSCYEKEAQYRARPEGTLRESDIVARQNNALRIGTLQLEWYDIHSNAQLGCDKITAITLNRLKLDQQQECLTIVNELQYEQDALNRLADHIVDELSDSLKQDAPRTAMPVIANNQQHCFFSSSFQHRKTLNELHELSNQFSP